MQQAEKRMRYILTHSMVELLNSMAFEKITINLICEQANINRSSFYRYYENKYDLLTDSLPVITNNLFNLNDINQNNDLDYIKQSFHWAISHKKLVKNIIISNEQYNTYLDLIKSASKSVHQTISSLSKDELNNNQIFKTFLNSPDPDTSIEMFCGMVTGIIQILVEKNNIDDVKIDSLIDYYAVKINQLHFSN
ncbi:TetR/AcrR family transcriptional regulator [Lentilactobacillus kosonis]|uniref:HTH tetR-type domain-containing protein n=1 Tax=Lentilactobacillus kosonis TaxID=2810561 RepID=A0A401FJE3_9LACO|nr:TetR/AcrR family transcriptional regulator [Lentilactobacillus kosonis]GAY72408.1 hypothetical protein NBRC111893_554 [Lentilactobacillus kosonis]